MDQCKKCNHRCEYQCDQCGHFVSFSHHYNAIVSPVIDKEEIFYTAEKK